MNRIVGLETEYGCLTTDPSGPPTAVGKVRNWIFEKSRFGLPDMHQRDWDEPAGNGGFLFNGGRAYVDMGHLEYCTPECLSLIDILRYDRAGDAILLQALKDLKLQDQVSFIRNNIDHYSGATFGCHENYLVRRSAPLTESNVLALLSFLTLRQLYAGAGRVGATPGAELRGDLLRPGADSNFQISQRADYINNDLFEWVQFNRAIINTRDEPLADARKYRRLHLLHGDTSVLPTTLLLKIGTTSLMLDLLELDHLPKIVLADAVMSFRTVSHQPNGPWIVSLADGKSADAVELLAQFAEVAKREFKGRDAETDVVLKIWEGTLAALSKEPEALVGKVDWITKRWLLTQFMTREQLPWSDPWLRAQDLEFHQIDPAKSLGLALATTPTEWELPGNDLQKAMREPPANTRAYLRSHIMQKLKSQSIRYFVDWEIIDAEGVNSLNLLNPFETSLETVDAWCKHLAIITGK
ncbi:MAG: proteasome accessory factor PafA2 family protein [Verrucomicrobiota bacterium]|nr:proteasome accessory factor PafA2 family protein [Verrucomicrobiota bacterium]